MTVEIVTRVDNEAQLVREGVNYCIWCFDVNMAGR